MELSQSPNLAVDGPFVVVVTKTILLAYENTMEADAKFYRGLFVLGVTFLSGFACGYKFKAWRTEWLKRRRERLKVKLIETQKEIDNLN